MKNATSKTINLNDYTQPAFWVDKVDLRFDLGEEKTQIHSCLQLRKNPSVESRTLVLDGEQLELGTVKCDGVVLTAAQYSVDDTTLTLANMPDTFKLEIDTLVRPQENFSLEGLYKSSGNFCTQCEAEGFRKITYYPDRPDVMAVFSTYIVADKSKYPVLLSNGNPVDRGDHGDGRHWALWQDPFKKPCYLFALVAGNLDYIEDHFTTMSGRNVLLRIYVESHNIEKCDHAMASLIRAMRWDEETFGREYDLDVYNIVAVDDFNMGAMENKGLNVFNSKYVLAMQSTATDTDFIGIEGVIGHEYFHNWSGNRVTCRDWFQLTLKEGLTVFRDQQFSADMNAAAPQRIDDVNILRTAQFAEDGGPMAHPIQPDSYQEINNFYTVTVYNKGAEVIRMIYTLLGKEYFHRGMDIYFDRFDGQAVTTEDFVSAMEAASDLDLTQFRRWYHQAGTPTLKVTEDYEVNSQRYTLTLSQTTPATPKQATKLPFHIPISVSLMEHNGNLMTVDYTAAYQSQRGETFVLDFTDVEQQFVFNGVKEKPVLSILKGYSAPVKLSYARENEELAFCMRYENDAFNRWDAGQQLATCIILDLVKAIQQQHTLVVPDYFIEACRTTLKNKTLDNALLARALALPSISYISEMMTVIDVTAIYRAREFIHQQMAQQLQADWLAIYEKNNVQVFDLTPASMGKRFVRNMALSYLMYIPGVGESLARAQFDTADNMTNQLVAFKVLVHHEAEQSNEVIDAFYMQWKQDDLVLDKWFSIQASAPAAATLKRVEVLFEHPDFDIKNPNRVRALLGVFCSLNPLCFHHHSGYGYQLLGQYIEKLDVLNPQIASRLSIPLTRWKRYDKARQVLMKAQLQRLLSLPKLSKDVAELVSKSL